MGTARLNKTTDEDEERSQEILFMDPNTHILQSYHTERSHVAGWVHLVQDNSGPVGGPRPDAASPRDCALPTDSDFVVGMGTDGLLSDVMKRRMRTFIQEHSHHNAVLHQATRNGVANAKGGHLGSPIAASGIRAWSDLVVEKITTGYLFYLVGSWAQLVLGVLTVASLIWQAIHAVSQFTQEMSTVGWDQGRTCSQGCCSILMMPRHLLSAIMDSYIREWGQEFPAPYVFDDTEDAADDRKDRNMEDTLVLQDTRRAGHKLSRSNPCYLHSEDGEGARDGRIPAGVASFHQSS